MEKINTHRSAAPVPFSFSVSVPLPEFAIAVSMYQCDNVPNIHKVYLTLGVRIVCTLRFICYCMKEKNRRTLLTIECYVNQRGKSSSILSLSSPYPSAYVRACVFSIVFIVPTIR